MLFLGSEINLQEKKVSVLQFPSLHYLHLSFSTGTQDIGKILIRGRRERSARCQTFTLPLSHEETEKQVIGTGSSIVMSPGNSPRLFWPESPAELIGTSPGSLLEPQGIPELSSVERQVGEQRDHTQDFQGLGSHITAVTAKDTVPLWPDSLFLHRFVHIYGTGKSSSSFL